MKAINDTVVIKNLRLSHEVGGIELYTTNNSVRYDYGEVITAAENTVLNTGDKVYYDALAGSELRHEGAKLLILRERDISLIDE